MAVNWEAVTRDFLADSKKRLPAILTYQVGGCRRAGRGGVGSPPLQSPAALMHATRPA